MSTPDVREPDPDDPDLAEHEKRPPIEPADADPSAAVRPGPPLEAEGTPPPGI